MAVVTMRQLLESGVHFGHQTRRWNPKMKRFIMTERNGIYIIDLQQSVTYINNAYEFVRETVAHGGTILFVGTKKQARSRSPSRPPASACRTSTTAGSVACSPTSRRSPSGSPASRSSRSSNFDDVAGSGYTKKELLIFKREKDKLEKTLGGIRTMGKVPSAVWIVDTKKEHLAVDEAKQARPAGHRDPRHQLRPRRGRLQDPRQRRRDPFGHLLTRVIADAVADGLMARAGGRADEDVVAADEPLAEWERELLGGDAAEAAAAAEGRR
jgi:small subunit ribosomal protein S2